MSQVMSRVSHITVYHRTTVERPTDGRTVVERERRTYSREVTGGVTTHGGGGGGLYLGTRS